MGAVDIVRVEFAIIVRDLTIHARDEAHEKAIIETIGAVPDVSVVNVSDRVFLLHLGGKIQIQNSGLRSLSYGSRPAPLQLKR